MTEATEQTNEQFLPFADAPSIVRAHQKDSYFESTLRQKLQDTLQILTSQRFVYTHPEEITLAAKAVYLALTTLVGSRTLGEEYTDLIYVTRDGRRIPRFPKRLGFILAYCVLPYYLNKLVKKSMVGEDEEKEKKGKGWRAYLSKMSYSGILDTMMSIHLALFYLNGAYYNLSKRFFGMRYALGHKQNEQVSNGGYELLGGMILAQMVFKLVGKFKEVVHSTMQEQEKEATPEVPQEIDLSNPKLLQFIPEASRKCMLCLSYMVNPSCAPCGHIFCWGCISDWSREHPECPLCRQALSEQSLLPLQ